MMPPSTVAARGMLLCLGLAVALLVASCTRQLAAGSRRGS